MDLRGDALDGVLVAPEQVKGKPLTTFHTRMPDDKNLVGLLEDKHVLLHVESAEASPLLRLVVGLLPRVLIVGAWLWLSAARKADVAGGGPLAGFLVRGKKYERSPRV